MGVLDGIVGQVLGTIGSVAAGSSSAKAQREANRLNYQMFQEQQAYNERMWNKANEYNSPLQQRLRYEEAGINPYLALSNITPGVAESMQSPQAPTAQSVGAGALGGLGQGLFGIGQSIQQSQLTQAQIDNINADTDSKQIHNEADGKYLIKERETAIKLSESGIDLNDAKTFNINELTKPQKDVYIEQAAKLASETTLNRSIEDLNLYQLKNVSQLQVQKLRQEIRNMSAVFQLTQSQISLNYKQAALLAEYALTEVEKRSGITLDNELKSKMLPLIIQGQKFENGNAALNYFSGYKSFQHWDDSYALDQRLKEEQITASQWNRWTNAISTGVDVVKDVGAAILTDGASLIPGAVASGFRGKTKAKSQESVFQMESTHGPIRYRFDYRR